MKAREEYETEDKKGVRDSRRRVLRKLEQAGSSCAAASAPQKKQVAAEVKKRIVDPRGTVLDVVKDVLNNDEVQKMVGKWHKKQDAFSDYATKPCCIHIIWEDRVKCLNAWSSKMEMPVTRKAAKQVLVVAGSASSTAATLKADR